MRHENSDRDVLRSKSWSTLKFRRWEDLKRK